MRISQSSASTSEVGILGTVLFRVYSGTILQIFTEIGSYSTDMEQKVKLAEFFRDTVYIASSCIVGTIFLFGKYRPSFNQLNIVGFNV